MEKAVHVITASKSLRYLLLALTVISMAWASDALTTSLMTFCTISAHFLGIVVIVLLVLAGVVYIGGLVLGAETKKRATVWAKVMLVGALIGMLIYVITPPAVIAILGPAAATCSLPSGTPSTSTCSLSCYMQCSDRGRNPTCGPGPYCSASSCDCVCS
jgi:hypothetical protein